MQQVLSQSEIDALLTGLADGDFKTNLDISAGDDDVLGYDLANQDRIIRGRMPTLDIIHDRFVRMFRLTLSSSLRKVIDIGVRSTELVKFGEFVNTLPVPSSLNLFRMNPLRGTGELENKTDGRDFTSIEQKIIKRIAIQALEDLYSAWRPVFAVNISYARSEVNPQFVSIVPQSEMVIVVTFDIEMGKAPMSMILCIPFSMIEPVRTQLQSGFQSDMSEMDSITFSRFRKNLTEAGVTMVVELGRAEINVREFLSLREGDVIRLDQEADQPLIVKVEGVPKMTGMIGGFKGQQSVKIKGLLYKPPHGEDFT
ncbi:hypothetical protein CHS0354_002038 [Potamilus streckersoni]|uniref:Flagellar motor switch protein FliM n=1 Tax=Potamilus streckersoni TaxID=2493646 RepID=A0AAE0W8K8_9BIVA|nr:hypothetical protein CHS0354_002038 [Potamilus streckersoni]